MGAMGAECRACASTKKEEPSAMPLSLTDKQLKQVMQAAALMPPGDRDGFMRSVAAVFRSDHPSDSEVICALCNALKIYGFTA
jgi:hypothetical protein